MQVSYFSFEGVSGEYFRCERYGTMSTDRCGSNYREAPAQQRAGRLDGCIRCPIGAKHSGGELTIAPLPAGWCVRCRRAPDEYGKKGGAKGMGRVRLVNGGRCVSCANREYEVRKGANAKGVAPKTWAAGGEKALGPQTAGIIEDGQVVTVRENLALDRIEVGLLALRRSARAVAMCWVGIGVLPAIPQAPIVEQLAMFGDHGGKSRRPLRAAASRIVAPKHEQFSLFAEQS